MRYPKINSLYTSFMQILSTSLRCWSKILSFNDRLQRKSAGKKSYLLMANCSSWRDILKSTKLQSRIWEFLILRIDQHKVQMTLYIQYKARPAGQHGCLSYLWSPFPSPSPTPPSPPLFTSLLTFILSSPSHCAPSASPPAVSVVITENLKDLPWHLMWHKIGFYSVILSASPLWSVIHAVTNWVACQQPECVNGWLLVKCVCDLLLFLSDGLWVH